MTADPLASLDTWKAIPDGERRAILSALATACGDPWRPGRTSVGRHGLGELVHGALGLGFVVVPGGWLRMGFSVDDIFLGAQLREERTDRSVWGNIGGARPTRWVRMQPFLLAIDGLPAATGEATTDGGDASIAYREAVKAAKGEDEDEEDEEDEEEDAASGRSARLVSIEDIDEIVKDLPEGLRLPTEAELEWVMREGGTTRWIGVAGDQEITADTRNEILLGDLESGFGIESFRDIQNPCADGAHWYTGESPTDQRALNVGAESRIGRSAHTYWQYDDGEMMGMHAAARAALDEYADTIIRVAADLPLAIAPLTTPPGPLAEHTLTIAALAGDDELARNDALVALGHLATHRGDDAAATVEAVIATLPSLAAPLRARMLRWLADVQVGGHYVETAQAPERLRPDAFPDRASSRAVVATATPQLSRYLDDADPNVRSAAALALSFSPQAPAGPALTARFAREDNIDVRAAIVLALARLGAPLPAVDKTNPVLAAAVAVGTAFDGSPDIEGLIAAIALDERPHLAFGLGTLGDAAVGVLRQVGDANAARRAAPIFAARAAREQHPGKAAGAIEMAFAGSDHPADSPRLAESLSADQRAVVASLIDMTENMPWQAHGLPATPSGRRRLLGLSPTGPADQVAYAPPDELTALLDALDPTSRLLVYLDRKTYELADVDDWELDDLVAALGDVRIAARAAVDAYIAHPDRPRGGAALIKAAVATRGASEPLDRALLSEIDDDAFGRDATLLARFPREDVETRLLDAITPLLRGALDSDRWAIGVDSSVEQWAPALSVVPSERAARWMLTLGWASGQPAACRTAIAEHGGASTAIAAVLAEYDALGEFTSWPQARAALAAFCGERP